MVTLSASAFAGSASANLSINGTTTGACSFGLSTPSLLFPFLSNGGGFSGTQSQTTVLSLSCSAGTNIQTYTAQSTNGWSMAGITDVTDLIPYQINASTAGAYSAFITTAWYIPGTITPISLIDAVEAGGFVINNAGDPVVSTLTVAAPTTIPSNFNLGGYTDNVAFVASY